MSLSDIIDILKQNYIVFLVMAVVTVGSIIANVLRLRKSKRVNASLKDAHPDAAKVYLTSKALITEEAVTVYTVNGDAPNVFYEGGKSGFYAPPGVVEVEMQYAYTRPGVLHKTVTTSTGLVTRKLELKPYGKYILGFDRKAEDFTFLPYEDEA